jgi:formylglycine-generating enzyme required for sulfatase activity
MFRSSPGAQRSRCIAPLQLLFAILMTSSVLRADASTSGKQPHVAPSPAAAGVPGNDACPVGQERSEETAGHCCWPGQVWSTRRSLCVGEPLSCPPDQVARDETCQARQVPSAAAATPEELGFVPIAGGSFLQGCEPQDAQCDTDEQPGHIVSIRPFLLMRTDVTVVMYARCVAAGVCRPPAAGGACNWGVEGRGDHPVNCIDWSQGKAFCAWAGGRLPSAAEWEYAAKGRESRVYPWGNEPPSGQRAHFARSDGTAPVRQYPGGASRDGLLDMAGNVWQLTAGEEGVGIREIRGGSWSSDAKRLRASYRGGSDGRGGADLGVRCAR